MSPPRCGSGGRRGEWRIVFLRLFFFHRFLLFYLAFFHLCTPPLMLSGSATIPRLQKTGGITDTTLEETCYLSISRFQDTVQYHH